MVEVDVVPVEAEATGEHGSKLGIWVFLATEVLFFGAIFVAFFVNRALHMADFAKAGRETDIVYGTVNTCVLLTSSFTVALAVRAAEARAVPLLRALLYATVTLAALFLVLKGFEYRDDLEKGLWPGPHFALSEPGAVIFWSFYWVATALHGLHVLIGIGVFTWVLQIGLKRADALEDASVVEVPALYWHFVDIVWIFLYPALYLGGRS